MLVCSVLEFRSFSRFNGTALFRQGYEDILWLPKKDDQLWDFFGRNDAKDETPVLWPPYVKSWLIGKDSDARTDWGQEEKGTTEDEMAGWHHGLDGRDSEWTPGVGDGQGGLACCDSWGHKESDTTEQLNWTEPKKDDQKEGRMWQESWNVSFSQNYILIKAIFFF